MAGFLRGVAIGGDVPRSGGYVDWFVSRYLRGEGGRVDGVAYVERSGASIKSTPKNQRCKNIHRREQSQTLWNAKGSSVLCGTEVAAGLLTVDDGAQVLHVPDVLVRGHLGRSDLVEDLRAQAGGDLWVHGEEVESGREGERRLTSRINEGTWMVDGRTYGIAGGHEDVEDLVLQNLLICRGSG
jgi:hypothetical protein